MSALKKITIRAKQIQKKKPNAKWTNLIKEASREYKSGKLGRIGSTPRKRVGMFKRKKYSVKKDIAKRTSAGLTVQSAIHFIKSEYEMKLGKAEVKLLTANTISEKKAARREIAQLKSALRKIIKK